MKRLNNSPRFSLAIPIPVSATEISKHFRSSSTVTERMTLPLLGVYLKACLLYTSNVLFKDVKENTQVWMSHGDTITVIPSNFKKIASTDKVAIAAYQIENEKVWGVQFHPEVFHSEDGTQMLKNFVVDVLSLIHIFS